MTIKVAHNSGWTIVKKILNILLKVAKDPVDQGNVSTLL